MVRSGFKNTKMLLPFNPFSIKNAAAIRHYAIKFVGFNNRRNPKQEEFTEIAAADERRRAPPSYWFPHPRSGIYFPQGQDWVMEDIPNHAASFHPTFWLRSADDGIDHKSHADDSTFHNSN